MPTRTLGDTRAAGYNDLGTMSLNKRSWWGYLSSEEYTRPPEGPWEIQEMLASTHLVEYFP